METSRKIDDMQVMASPTVAVASAPQSQIRIGPSGGFTPSSPERNLEDGEVAVPFPASAAGRQIVGSPASPRERKLAPKPHFKKKKSSSHASATDRRQGTTSGSALVTPRKAERHFGIQSKHEAIVIGPFSWKLVNGFGAASERVANHGNPPEITDKNSKQRIT